MKTNCRDPFPFFLPKNRTAINDTNVYVLYAQTGTFNITGDSCTDPTTSSTCYAPASTVYVTQTATADTSATGELTITHSPPLLSLLFYTISRKDLLSPPACLPAC